ncbi:threonine synthase [Agrococcus sp. TSP3-2-1]|uniref:threonine synthase n=1 Tax=Agrococcus sp. TSP3-2-1 TaxID=2804583 RepID=UPI003CF957C8
MAKQGQRGQWRGVLHEWADVLDVGDASTVVTLGEGGTPLIESKALSAMTDARVFVKFEGLNPTGSFKDRGMTVAISRAIERGAKAIACASTGNTSASAAAYAAAAGIQAIVLVPEGRISMGKLAQSVVHGARIVQVRGNFDDCLEISKELAERYPVHLVNSVNDDRIEGQKTAALEIVDVLGDAPDIHCIPVGNAGNISSYWRGYSLAETEGWATKRPRMLGFQAAGAAPIVRGEVVREPDTVATAIRIGNPASWHQALEARDASGGHIGAIDDAAILRAQRLLASSTGVFVEPASAISVAGLLERHAAGQIPAGSTVALTVTGHGLKDAQWGLKLDDGSDAAPESADADTAQVAALLGLS